MSTLRKVMMLPITPQLCRKLGVGYHKIICENVKGVFVDHLTKVFASMINEGLLPGDAKLSFLYEDSRFQGWCILIESEMYPELQPNKLAPLLDFE